MIYLDNAATTRLAPEVLDAMMPYLTDDFGNPGTAYSYGARAKKAVNGARRIISAMIGAKPEEIFFTSGGTEADNWALKGAAEGRREEGKHIITTEVEHHAVLRACRYLETVGYEVTCLKPDRYGVVSPDKVSAAIRPDTILVSVMFANNEIGTLEPIEEIGAVTAEKGVLFHTDAVQAFGQVPIDVNRLHIDLLSASGHKVNGPKGIGFLYIRSGIKLGRLMHGGAQERGMRAGTENVPGIVGLGAAAERAQRMMEEKTAKETRLRDYLIGRIEREIPDCCLNGHRTVRLPGNVNFSFRDIEGESALLMLDMKGICASSGSACTTGEGPSHVLRAIGMSEEEAGSALRMTLSEENTAEEMDIVVDNLREIICKLREMRGRNR